jgi:hypothetical protein
MRSGVMPPPLDDFEDASADLTLDDERDKIVVDVTLDGAIGRRTTTRNKVGRGTIVGRPIASRPPAPSSPSSPMFHHDVIRYLDRALGIATDGSLIWFRSSESLSLVLSLLMAWYPDDYTDLDAGLGSVDLP